MPPQPGNHHSVKYHAHQEFLNARRNRTRHRQLAHRFRVRGHKDPGTRANDQIMAEAAHERHQRTMVNLTGKPENMGNYEPGGKHHRPHAMDDEDEFGGGRRRRRTRRHRKSRRHTRKY